MPVWLEILLAFVASSGFWALLTKIFDHRSNQSKMLLGLGHDKIIYLCKCYIARGYISPDEYENLHDYLYIPYKAMGGNGTAERLMEEVKKLPIKKEVTT